MNQMLSASELALLSSQLPPPLPALTRTEKLLRLAMAIRKSRTTCFIWSGLEHCSQAQLDELHDPHSAFAAAARDPVLEKAGLKPDASGNVTAGAAMRFFELSLQDTHEFSCDCGGRLSKSEMAMRVERIAGR